MIWWLVLAVACLFTGYRLGQWCARRSMWGTVRDVVRLYHRAVHDWSIGLCDRDPCRAWEWENEDLESGGRS